MSSETLNPPSPEPGAALASRLQAITDRLHQEVSRLTGMQAAKNAELQLNMLQNELDEMGELIAHTRTEIAGLLPIGTPNSCLSTASDELGNVVSATERAAVEIMVAAEHTQEAVQRLRSACVTPEATAALAVIDGAVMDIFMACSFQDLTGQRIRKVVQALTYIEQRVISLSALWRGSAPTSDSTAVPAWETRADAHLLNGPSNSGLEQDAIDALMQPGTSSAVPSQADIDALFS